MRLLPPSITMCVGLAACNDPAPQGYQPGAAAIPQAERFRERAEACFRDAMGGAPRTSACTEATSLYEELRFTPIHFGDQAEWERFREAFSGANNLLLQGLLSELCHAPARERLTDNQEAICNGRRAILEERASQSFGNAAFNAQN